MKETKRAKQITFVFNLGLWVLLIPTWLNAQTPPDLAWKRNSIEVFANLTSIRQGDPISFYVATGDSFRNNATYKIEIYRVGASGDSLCATLNSSLHLTYQPLHDSLARALPWESYTGKPLPREYKTGCVGAPANWSIATTANGTTTSGWKSGFYFAQCSLIDTPSISRRTPFVVKQLTPGNASNILYKVPVNAYQAYNAWGGSSLYPDDGPLVKKNDTVSFLRPLGDRPDHLERTDIGSFDLAERSFIQWAESKYIMEYCTNIDLDSDATVPFPMTCPPKSDPSCILVY